MGNFHESIPLNLIPWIQEQKMFWVATAPLNAQGHVNLSPKGADGSFHVTDSQHCWYEDLTGSGVETISHIRENGRITILFNAFVGPPRICRLFGKGTSYELGSPKYNELIPLEKRKPGSRAVIMVEIHKVGTSCGYAIPYYQFQNHRTILDNWAVKRESVDEKEGEGGVGGMKEYWRDNNLLSIDRLPGLLQAVQYRGVLHNVAPKLGNLAHARSPGVISRQNVIAFLLGGGVVCIVMMVASFAR